MEVLLFPLPTSVTRTPPVRYNPDGTIDITIVGLRAALDEVLKELPDEIFIDVLSITDYRSHVPGTVGVLTDRQLGADMIRERTRSGIEAAKAAEKHTGRPPFGFDVNEGYLTPNENYDTAVEILERIEKSESKRSTARFAGVSRSTVGRILDRTGLYRDQGPAMVDVSTESAAGD